MVELHTKKKTATRARSLAFCGLTIALMAVSAWISVPLGPVPFTLQTFVMVFALIVLTPGQCLASIGCYLVIGAIGIPVFSSMRGGLGVVLGPTGGFLWGFFVGAVVALAVMRILEGSARKEQSASSARLDPQTGARVRRSRELAASFVGAFLFVVVMYLCGWVQLMAISGMGPAAAFVTAVAPFIVVDLVKTIVGVLTARAVNRAIR